MASQGDQTLATNQTVVTQVNLFDPLPNAVGGEVFTPLLNHGGVKIERIVTLGQTTPADAPYVQAWDEWVVILSGSASVQIEDQSPVDLNPGDQLFIPANARHWVTRSALDQPTLWLAVHFT